MSGGDTVLTHPPTTPHQVIQMSQAPKKRLGARITRALFNGLSLGILGGAGIYILAEGVDSLAGTQVLNPIAFLLLIVGGTIVTSIGIELSKDLSGE